MKTMLNAELAPAYVPTNLECKIGAMHINIPIGEFSPETLAALCDEFRANVFKAAGKEPPEQLVTTPVAVPASNSLSANACRAEAMAHLGDARFLLIRDLSQDHIVAKVTAKIERAIKLLTGCP